MSSTHTTTPDSAGPTRRRGAGAPRAATQLPASAHQETLEVCVLCEQVLKDGSELKRANHLKAVQREITVLKRLRGSLNVVSLEVRQALGPA